jgi:hypothetical protein
MRSIHFLSYNAFASNGASFQYRDDNLNFIDTAEMKPNATLPIGEAKAQLQIPHKLRWGLDIWNGCGLLSYTSTPKDVYKYCKRQNYRGSSLLKGMRWAEWAGKPWWANSKDLGLRSGGYDVGVGTNISLRTQTAPREEINSRNHHQGSAEPRELISRLLSRDL